MSMYTYGFLFFFVFIACLSLYNLESNVALVDRKRRVITNHTTVEIGKFPKIVHQMWKTKSHLPYPTSKWRGQCVVLNQDYDFRMYTDEALLDFVKIHYPQYIPLYESLHGVYQADMARILIVYHYGGLYMDLDFYCHRPFSCLLDQLPSSRPTIHRNLLVVSREPKAHATIFREKERVVIQDFFLSTPRHPFLKWLLDDRLINYNEDILNGRKTSKGPFSYSIERHIDAYHEYSRLTKEKAVMNTNKDDDKTRMIQRMTLREKYAHIISSEYDNYHDSSEMSIIELEEDVMHSLIDSTNHRLYEVCEKSQIASMNTESCMRVNKKQFFRPSKNTVAVHMWMHTFLGWTWIRYVFNWNIYRQVESELPSKREC